MAEVVSIESMVAAMETARSINVREVRSMRARLNHLRAEVLYRDPRMRLKDANLFITASRACAPRTSTSARSSPRSAGAASTARRLRPLRKGAPDEGASHARSRTRGGLRPRVRPIAGRADIQAQGSEHSVELRGSTSLYPLAQRVAEAYMQEHPNASIIVSGESRSGG